MALDIRSRLISAACVPRDAADALLVGRVWLPDGNGPVVVRIDGDDLLDLSGIAPTTSELFDHPHVARAIRDARRLPRVGSLQQALGNSHREGEPQSDAFQRGNGGHRLGYACDAADAGASGKAPLSHNDPRTSAGERGYDAHKKARGESTLAPCVARRVAHVGNPGGITL